MMRGKTIPFMAISIAFMIIALLTGIFRLMSENAIGPPFLVALYGLHPLLMVFGFIAGIIMTERIAGIDLLPVSKGPRLSVSMIPFVFVGMAIEAVGYVTDSVLTRWAGALLLVIGSALFLILISSFYRKGRENLSVTFMMISAVSLLISCALSALELPAGNVGFVMLLLLFPIIFILGERVELTSLASNRPSARLRPVLAILVVCVLLFALSSVTFSSSFQFGLNLIPFLLLIVTFGVFLREERVSTQHIGQTATHLQKYVRLHVSTAYVWGLIGSIFGAIYVLSPTFQAYDAFIHSLALGFIGMMFLAHGPVILPAVIRHDFAQERLSEVPLVLLTSAVALRISGNLALMSLQSDVLRLAVSVSGWIVLAAVVAFLVEIATGTRGASLNQNVKT